MPAETKKFIENIEGETGVKVSLIGTGPELYDVVDRRS
jgi:adenylosuccinate synthase